MTEGQALAAPERMDALARAVLLDTPREEAFDRATRLASRLIGAPVALASIVDHDRQFFKSQVGLPEPWASDRQTPLSHSFCQHVVTSGDVFEVTDARDHDLVRDNLAIRDLDVIAYLGVPITDPDGNVLGSFCVIDDQPREWSGDERELLRDIAGQVRQLVAVRVALAQLEEATRQRDDLLAVIAHDLRGPVTNIRAAADMVGDLPAEEQQPFVDVIRRAAERMESLVSGLVASERAGLPSRVGRMDLSEVVRGVVDRHPQRHRIDVDTPEQAAMTTDRDAIVQIVSNLLDAALHRAPADTEVRLVLRQHDGVADVTVSDAGSVAGDELDELFDATGPEPGRLGLSMHIVQRLTAALAGRVAAESDEDSTSIRVEVADLTARADVPA